MDNGLGARLLRSISIKVGDSPWDAWEYAGYDGILDQVHVVDRNPTRNMKTVPFDQVQAVVDHEIVPFRGVWAALVDIFDADMQEHRLHPRRKPDFSRIPPKLPQSHWLDVLESKRDED